MSFVIAASVHDHNVKPIEWIVLSENRIQTRPDKKRFV